MLAKFFRGLPSKPNRLEQADSEFPSSRRPDARRIIIAEHLRRYTDIAITKNEKEQRELSGTADDSFEEQKNKFLQSEFHEQEFQALELRIIDAAKIGQYQVEVMKFPADYCSDRGRAINNFEGDWPETLQGKARSFYAVWNDHGKPHGYRLKVKINSYPQGFIGEVSLFVDWS